MSGHMVNLDLTDPDSNQTVPPDGPRFAGNFMLTSQGDQQQITGSSSSTCSSPATGTSSLKVI